MPSAAISLTQEDFKNAEREYCKRSLSNFVRRAWAVVEPIAPYVHGKAIDVLCDALQAVTEGRSKRLLINIPPGTGKSLITSVLWPAWEWGPCNAPHTRYVAVAHDLDLAMRDTAKMRRLIKSDWYQEHWPHVAISSDQDAKKRFENTATGFRVAKSSTGVTGERGDRVIFDDPHSVSGANSDTIREEVVRNFREAVNTRINNPELSAIVVIMQRLHAKDVSGSILELGGWDHVCLPMRFVPKLACDVDWRTEDGELLFPERFPEAAVQELERTLGPYAAAGQLQQTPTPRQGGLFDSSKIEIVDVAPPCVRWVRSWDFAASVPKPGQDPDWSVGLKMGMTRDQRFVIAANNRFRKNPTGVDAELIQTASMDGKGVRVRLAQDPGAAGKSQVQMQVRALRGYTAVSKPVSGSKITRAEPLASQVGGGNVLMVRGDWNQALIDELSIFPGGAHDDQVDAAADAFDELVNGKWIGGMPRVVGITV